MICMREDVLDTLVSRFYRQGEIMGLNKDVINRLLHLAEVMSKSEKTVLANTKEFKEVTQLMKTNRMDFVYAAGVDKTLILRQIGGMFSNKK